MGRKLEREATPQDWLLTQNSHQWQTIEQAADKSSAWEEALSKCYLNWELTKSVDAAFTARFRSRLIDEIKLVECFCQPCSGRRVLKDIGKEKQPFIGIQIVLGGAERFGIAGKSIHVGRGDIIFWNSHENTEFEVLESLHKITLLMPQALLETRLELGMLVQGGRVDTDTAIGALLFSQIRTLASNFSAIPRKQVYGVKWSMIELAAAAAVWLQQPIATPCQDHMRRIQSYILKNLQDPDLSLRQIAQANSISIRYVHALFNPLGTTAARWIMDQRLERCRDALVTRRGDSRGVVKDVALQWGFSDAAYFGRLFKRRFGQTPMAFRARAIDD